MKLFAEKTSFLFLVSGFLGDLGLGTQVAIACGLGIGITEVITSARVLFFFLLFFGRIVSHLILGGLL